MAKPAAKKVPKKRPSKISYKAAALRSLFHSKYDAANPQEVIDVSIKEVVSYLDQNGIDRPGNIHNFFKDLARSGRMPRYLSEIEAIGYQINQTEEGGAFVRSEKEDLRDRVILSIDQEILEVSSNAIPKLAFELVRTDEGSVISVVEYCEILASIFRADVHRVQTPLKVQPNEIDGCYILEKDARKTLLSVEAKSKGADVLLKHQIYGAARQALKYFGDNVDEVVPIGIKIASDNTIYVVVFDFYSEGNTKPAVSNIFRFKLDPAPPNWIKQKGQQPLL